MSGGKKATLAQVVQTMEESATQDIRAAKVLPTVFQKRWARFLIRN